MKQYELTWVPEMRKSSDTADTYLAAEKATSPGVMAYISPTCDNAREYTTPYTLHLSFRKNNAKATYHTSIEEAKRVATEEVTDYYWHIAEQLGYKYET